MFWNIILQLKKLITACLTSWFWFGMIIWSIPFCAPSPLQKLPFLPINGIELLVVLLLVTDCFLLKERLGRRPDDLRVNPWPLLWLALFLLAAVGGTLSIQSYLTSGLAGEELWSSSTPAGYAYLKLLGWVVAGAFFLTCVFILNSWDRIKKTIVVYITAVTSACLYGFFLVLSYWRGGFFLVTREQYYLVRWWQTHTSPPRFLGTAIEPQNFANLLLTVLPLTLALYLAKTGQTRSRHLWLGLAFFIQLGSLLTTFSGAGLAAGIIGCLFLVVSGWHFWDKIRLSLTVALSLGLVGLIIMSCLWLVPDFPSAISDWLGKFSPAQQYLSSIPRQKLLANPNTSSVVERHWLRQAAQKMFIDNPWLGRGVGGFASDYWLYRPPGGLSYQNYLPRVHNQYWEVLAEHGLIGAGLLLLFFGSLAQLFGKIRQNDDQKLRVLILALGTVLISLAIQSWSFGTMQHLYFWLVLGSIYALGSLLEDRRSKNR